MNVFKAVYYSAIERWLDDMPTIRKRLLYWPLAIPAMFFFLIAIAVTVNTSRSGQNGDLSSVGGVVVALIDNEVGQSIANVLVSPPTSYEVIFVDEKQIIDSVNSKKATFGIYLDAQNGQVFKLVYDKTRNYPHKNWIDKTKSRLNELNIAIKRDMLMAFNVPTEQRQELLKPVQMEVESFGSGNSVELIVGLMLALWTVLFIYPLECTKSIFSSLFTEDVTHDLLPLWLCARAKKSHILLGRLTAGLTIFTLSMLAITLHVTMVAGLFYYLIDLLITQVDAPILSDPRVIPYTTGYLEFIDELTPLTLLKMFSVFLLLGFTALAVMLPGTIFAKTSEQARTNNMLIDIGLSISPIVGFLVGYSGPSIVMSMVPILGTYHVLLSTLAGDSSFLMILAMLTTNTVLIMVLVLLSTKFLCHFKRTNFAMT